MPAPQNSIAEFRFYSSVSTIFRPCSPFFLITLASSRELRTFRSSTIRSHAAGSIARHVSCAGEWNSTGVRVASAAYFRRALSAEGSTPSSSTLVEPLFCACKTIPDSFWGGKVKSNAAFYSIREHGATSIVHWSQFWARMLVPNPKVPPKMPTFFLLASEKRTNRLSSEPGVPVPPDPSLAEGSAGEG